MKGKKTARLATTKSDQIRQMYADGKSIPEIKKALGICYAFAYQVIQRDLLVQGKPMDTKTPHEPKKTLAMIELHKQGLTPGEIAHKLNVNYVFAWRTITDYKNRQKIQ